MVTSVSFKQLHDVLMDQSIPLDQLLLNKKNNIDPEEQVGLPKKSAVLLTEKSPAYFVIHSPETEENLTVLLSGKLGTEYNKTIGFMHKSPGVLIYRCIYGQGVVMIQKNDDDDIAKEVRVASIRPGVEVEIPFGYMHCIVNTGKKFLVVVDNGSMTEAEKDYKPIKQKHGFAYYIVEKKGEIGFERNPNYSYFPQITNI